MIFNEDIIFIHIGKTGGMSCSLYLLKNLKPTIYNCHDHAEREIAQLELSGVKALGNTRRHWTLEQSLGYIKLFNRREIESFQRIFAVIRHPVTLEYSFYNHLQKPHVRRNRGAASSPLIELSEGSFYNFVKHAGYHAPGKSQDAFFRVNKSVPENVELIKFERIDETFTALVKPFCVDYPVDTFNHLNKTVYPQSLEDLLDSKTKDLIFKKHQYMFDYGYYSMDEIGQ